MDKIKKICRNCDDFIEKNNSSFCGIRYLIDKDGGRKPMPVTKNKKGCEVFMYKIV